MMPATRYYIQKPQVVAKPKLEAKPHAMPWITKEMLTGRKAPVAKVKA